MGMLPASRPSRTWDQLRVVLEEYKAPTDKPIVIGQRGYYRDTMGEKGINDRAIYDDALFIWTPLDRRCVSFNGNTDPSRHRPGYGFEESKKGMAVLNVGLWPMRPGLHRGKYRALRQDGVFVVTRDGYKENYLDTGDGFGINIHCGGVYTTSSLGCQTVPPEQWDEFMPTLDAYKKRMGIDVNNRTMYLLIERQG
jgi:hypothetical protein